MYWSTCSQCYVTPILLFVQSSELCYCFELFISRNSCQNCTRSDCYCMWHVFIPGKMCLADGFWTSCGALPCSEDSPTSVTSQLHELATSTIKLEHEWLFFLLAKDQHADENEPGWFIPRREKVLNETLSISERTKYFPCCSMGKPVHWCSLDDLQH